MKHFEAVLLGQSLVGKTAQSRILTVKDATGNKVMAPAQEITGYTVLECCGGWECMATIGGIKIFADLLKNVK
jgi:hypothetical protein